MVKELWLWHSPIPSFLPAVAGGIAVGPADPGGGQQEAEGGARAYINIAATLQEGEGEGGQRGRREFREGEEKD